MVERARHGVDRKASMLEAYTLEIQFCFPVWGRATKHSSSGQGCHPEDGEIKKIGGLVEQRAYSHSEH